MKSLVGPSAPTHLSESSGSCVVGAVALPAGGGDHRVASIHILTPLWAQPRPDVRPALIWGFSGFIWLTHEEMLLT